MTSNRRKKMRFHIPERVKTLDRVPINFEETDWEGYIGPRTMYERLEDRIQNKNRDVSLRI